LRVLWFTNTPSLSAAYLNNESIGGGWIGSLESELSHFSSIELGISFNFNRYTEPFKLNRTKYYPIHIPSPKGKVKSVMSRWRKRIQNENDVQRYLEVINQFKPDVIHIFGTEGVFGLIISKTNIPCIIHLQGNLIICNHKWYTGLTAVDVLKYSKKLHLLKGFGLYHNYFINKKEANRERKIFERCKFFMGRTDWDRRITSVLSPSSKYFHCDEIMRYEFYLQQWSVKKNRPACILITTMRNNIYKGLETIFQCKRILNELNLRTKIVWKIAGISETDELPYLLERKYKSTFSENQIELLGPLAEKELINEMMEADTFIHTSHIDNSPNSLCEAMLLGMPIIATFAGGIPSILENKKEGLLVQDGDPYALAGAILELEENSNYAIEFGINARAKAFSRHNPQKIVDKLLHIYSSIANQE
jgi:glycosyltransferase involved in cell wall biosynthesis